jgi:alpha-L-fucosidase 2
MIAALALVAGACASGGGRSGGTAGAGGTTGAAGGASAGTTGSAGATGVAGTSGVAGTPGPAGASGLAGDPGVAGGGGVTGQAGAGPAGAGGAPSAPPTSVVDGPTGQAFDPVKGALNVDYAAYFPKNDIVYNKPNTNPLYGLPLGNGRTGALVWSENGLTMQVSGVDLSQQSAYAGGLVSFNTNPALDAGGGAFQQRLASYDGEIVTKYGADRTVTILGAAGSEVIGIHVVDTRAGVTSATVDLSLWDLSTLQNFNAPSIDTWKTIATYAEAGSAGLSRGQTDANHFGYTMAATVEGAAFKTAANGPSGVRLLITPSASYTIWIVCASRLNAAGNDSVAEAKAALARVTTAGFAPTAAAYLAFWHAFWQRSFVQYSNAGGDADYLETAYVLATQMIAAGGFGNYPFHFINGVERATQDKTKWSNAYWYWNQRDVYNSFFASNHADVMAVFNHMYSRNFDTLKAFTMSRYGIDGIWVPETMGWNGSADGTTGSDYTKNIYSTGTEAAMNMYAQFAYTGDADYLKTTVYPFMREVAKFYVKKFTKDAASGKYVMTSSNSHETYWNVRNALTDLAAVRQMFPVAIKTSQSLGLDADLRPQWQDLLDNLVAYPNDGTKYLPHEPPLSQTRNDENIVGELLWPYAVTGLDAPDYAMALAAWKVRPFPYDNVWANDAIQAARLGLGDEANAGMKTMLQKYQSYPNGMTNNTNGVFEYLGVHLSAMNESLLQSYNDKIRVFPALPKDAGLVTRFTLAARGGFLVTSEREGGDIKYVGLKSLLGNAATVVNPWGATAVQVRKVGAGANVLSSSSATLSFPTDKDGVYVIERVAKPLGGFTWSVVTGTANQNVKKLGTSNTLGLAAP